MSPALRDPVLVDVAVADARLRSHPNIPDRRRPRLNHHARRPDFASPSRITVRTRGPRSALCSAKPPPKRTLVLLISLCAEICSVSRTSIRFSRRRLSGMASFLDRTWPHRHVTSPACRLHAAARILACSGSGSNDREVGVVDPRHRLPGPRGHRRCQSMPSAWRLRHELQEYRSVGRVPCPVVAA